MNSNKDINYFTGPMTVGDTISRGWRLYRLHFAKILTYSILVVGIITSIGILTKPTNMPTIMAIPGYFFEYPFISLLFLFMAIIFNYFFIKIFYNILSNKDTHFKTILSSFRYQFVRVLKFSLLFFFELVFFLMIDIFLFVGIGFLLAALISSLESILFRSDIMNDAFILLAIVGSLLYFFVFFNLFLFQLYFCTCQLIALVIDDLPIKFCFVKACEVTFGKFLRFMLFTIFISALCFALYSNFTSLFFMLVASIVFPITHQFFSPSFYEASSFVASCIDLLGFSLSLALFWPLLISSLTLYYCDLKMRKEGLDLTRIIIKEKENYYSEKIKE